MCSGVFVIPAHRLYPYQMGIHTGMTVIRFQGITGRVQFADRGVVYTVDFVDGRADVPDDLTAVVLRRLPAAHLIEDASDQGSDESAVDPVQGPADVPAPARNPRGGTNKNKKDND